MNTSNADLLQRARASIKAGDRNQARLLLQQAIRQDLTDHLAWAWLAAVTTSSETSLKYARRARQLKGDDPLVQKVLAWAEKRAQAVAAAETTIDDQTPETPTAGGDGAAVKPAWQIAAIWASIAIVAIMLLGVAGSIGWSLVQGSPQSVAYQEEVNAGVRAAAEVETKPESTPVKASAEGGPAKATVTATATPLRIQAKHIAAGGEGDQAFNPLPTWTVTPSPTNTPVPTPTYVPTFISPQNSKPMARPFGVGPEERWVDVDLTAQSLTAYEGNKPVFNTLVSTGLRQYPTVTGQFRIWVRYRSQTMDGRRLGYDYFLENVPYVMYFFEDYALHGTYWHNNFGTPMSHGCVNLKTSDAEWIFNWSSLGTLVNVHY